MHSQALLICSFDPSELFELDQTCIFFDEFRCCEKGYLRSIWKKKQIIRNKISNENRHFENCRFDPKKRFLVGIRFKQFEIPFFIKNYNFSITISIFTKNCHFDTKKVHFWRKWGTVFDFRSRLNLICPVYISMYSRGYSVPSLIGYFFNLKSSRF